MRKLARLGALIQRRAAGEMKAPARRAAARGAYVHRARAAATQHGDGASNRRLPQGEQTLAELDAARPASIFTPLTRNRRGRLTEGGAAFLLLYSAPARRTTAESARGPGPSTGAGTRNTAALLRRAGSTYTFRGRRRADGAQKAFFGRFECPRATFPERRQLPNPRCSARRGGHMRRRRLEAASKPVVFRLSLNWSTSRLSYIVAAPPTSCGSVLASAAATPYDSGQR